jgi:hypothetical protein
MIIESFWCEHPSWLVIIIAGTGAHNSCYIQSQYLCIMVDPSAFKLGGVHLDRFIGRFSHAVTWLDAVNIIHQDPDMECCMYHARVLIIDDGNK